MSGTGSKNPEKVRFLRYSRTLSQPPGHFRKTLKTYRSDVPIALLGVRGGGPDPALTLGEGAVFWGHCAARDEIGAR
jgi:hypothetical protein